LRYRYEHKYFINHHTAAILRSRASGIMKPDENADESGSYVVNNIYLDDRRDSFYLAKVLGHYSRDKYRLRYYNDDLSFIRLERKHKDGILNYKDTLPITLEQFEAMSAGDFNFIYNETAPLWQKIATVHRLRGLRPTAAYSYRRETLTYFPANTRLTIDSPLTPMYTPVAPTCGKQSYELLLEVKFTGFFPELIKRLLDGLSLVHTEASKYGIARESKYLSHNFTHSI
jgi:hypothetical protein